MLWLVWFCSGLPLQIQAQTAPALERAPQRIVSLQPALTEVLCALEQCQRLVGIDRYSSWPAEALAHVPKVGGGLDPSLEAIIALQPDAVLLSRAAPVGERLRALGVRTVVLDAQNLAEVQHMIVTIAALVHQPAAGAQLWQQLQAGLDGVAQRLPPTIAGTRVYVEVGQGPYAAGASSYLGEILTRMGMVNVVPAEMGPFPLVSPEFVLRAAPQVVIQGAAAAAAPPFPGWGQLPAVREQRICRFDAEQINILVRPGPRMAQAAQLLAQCLIDKAPRHAKPSSL